MFKQTEECRVQFGEFCCALRFPTADSNYVLSVKDYFKNFISENEPDIIVEIAIILHSENITVPESLCVSKNVDGSSFDYSSGLIKGHIDIKEKRCFIKVMNVLFGNPTIRIFEQFFHQLYFSLLEHRYGSGRFDKFMLHSCGVLRNGQGYVFTGPSGSGKSTVADLSSGFDILNDEMCLISKKNGSYTVQSTPFNGFFRSKINSCGPLKNILFLKQDLKNYKKNVSIADCIVPFAREIVPPTGILSTEKKHSLSAMIDIAMQFLPEIPFCELHFLPDKSFWNCIN